MTIEIYESCFSKVYEIDKINFNDLPDIDKKSNIKNILDQLPMDYLVFEDILEAMLTHIPEIKTNYDEQACEQCGETGSYTIINV